VSAVENEQSAFGLRRGENSLEADVFAVLIGEGEFGGFFAGGFHGGGLWDSAEIKNSNGKESQNEQAEGSQDSAENFAAKTLRLANGVG